MEKTLILIRHGEGYHQKDRFIGGWSDVELTEEGHAQAKKTATRLKKMVPKNVLLLSSDLKRAYQTAEHLAEQLDVPIVVNEKLREIYQGDVEGMHRDEAAKIKAKVEGDIMNWRPYPNAESWREFDQRIMEFMRDLQAYDDKVVIIVCHSQTIVSIIHNWMGLTEEQKKSTEFRIQNCSLTILSKDVSGYMTIETINDVGHLEKEHSIRFF